MNNKFYNSVWVLSCVYAVSIFYMGITGKLYGFTLDLNRTIIVILAFCFTFYSWYVRK